MFVLIKGILSDTIGSCFLSVDILTIITAYLFLFHSYASAGTFAYCQGFLIDVFSGGMHGLFTSAYLSVFAGISIGFRFFNLKDPRGQMIIICLAVLLKKGIFILFLSLFSPEVYLPKSFLWISGASALLTGLVTPVVFYLFTGLRFRIFRPLRRAVKGGL